MTKTCDRKKNSRWFDKHPNLSICLEKLKKTQSTQKNDVIMEMKDIMIKYDRDFIDRHSIEFPIRRRWYDFNPYSWMVINSLQYSEKPLLNKITQYLERAL